MNDLFYKHLSLKNVFFLVGVILTIFLAYKNIDMTLMFFASVVVACSLEPLVCKLEKKIGRKKASALILGTFILLLIIFILPVLAVGVYEIKTLISSLFGYFHGIDELVEKNQFLQTIGITQATFNEQLSGLSAHAGTLFDKTVEFFKGFGSVCVYLFISLVFTYFFMADRESIKKSVIKLFPKNMREKTEEIIDTVSKKIGGYIIAQLYAITSVGVIMAIGLSVFRVEYGIILALITAILDIIPIIGPFIALIICLVVAFGTGVLPIIGVILTFIVAQIIENQVVRPYAYSKLLKLHPILIFAFLYLGAKYFGVVGALFSPAIAAIVCVFIEEIYMKAIE